MSSKKICVITTISVTMEMFVIASMRKLKEDGYDVTLVCTMDDLFLNKYSEEFRCINIKMERGNDFKGMIKSIFLFYKLFKRENFEIIQYATPNASLYASIASFLNRSKRRIYCQWGIRYVGFEGKKREFYKIIEKLTCLLSTHIRPVSFKNLEFAVQEGLYNKTKAKVIGIGGTVGIDFNIFDVSLKEKYKLEVLNEYPSLKGKTIYGFIGRVVKDKGFNELVLSFRKLHEKYNDVALVIIGNYEQDLDPVDPELLEWALKQENIIFTGHISKIDKYISLIDILVHPSYREGFSMVIQQALAMKIAVITTDIPGPSEVIEPNVSGLLATVKDTSSLFLALEKLYIDKELRESFANSGYERARKYFNRENMVENILQDRNNLLKNNYGN